MLSRGAGRPLSGYPCGRWAAPTPGMGSRPPRRASASTGSRSSTVARWARGRCWRFATSWYPPWGATLTSRHSEGSLSTSPCGPPPTSTTSTPSSPPRRASSPAVPASLPPRSARRHPAKRHEILHHSSWSHPDVFRDGAIGGVRAQPVKRRQNARPALRGDADASPHLRVGGAIPWPPDAPGPEWWRCGRLADHPVGGCSNRAAQPPP
jgi:hypothetical protein